MPKKNSLFSGQKLSDRERQKIEEQLKRSRERDIAAMEETNKRREKRSEKSRGRRITNLYQGKGFSNVKGGKEAEDKWILMKKALSKNIYKELDEEYQSGDILAAADYIAENYVPGKSGTYFNKQDMIDTIQMLKDRGYDLLDEDDEIPF